METLFSNFPTITYNGTPVVDITKAITMVPTVQSNPFSFAPYSIIEGKRSDQVADEVYGDPYLEWLVFLANQQVDPYAWYMNTEQFQDFLEQKYGDWIRAQAKIKYYTNNWYNGQTLTVSGYDALSPVISKYYQPVLDAGNNVIEYIRTPSDWMVDTNHLVTLNFTTNVSTLTLDEIVNIAYDVGVTGNGQVAFTTSNALHIRHVSGNYLPNNNIINASAFSIYGQESNTTITIAHANQVSVAVYDTLDPLEDVYYDAVSYYDYENQLNEMNKNIVVLANTFTKQITKEITALLQ